MGAAGHSLLLPFREGWPPCFLGCFLAIAGALNGLSTEENWAKIRRDYPARCSPTITSWPAVQMPTSTSSPEPQAGCRAGGGCRLEFLPVLEGEPAVKPWGRRPSHPHTQPGLPQPSAWPAPPHAEPSSVTAIANGCGAGPPPLSPHPAARPPCHPICDCHSECLWGRPSSGSCGHSRGHITQQFSNWAPWAASAKKALARGAGGSELCPMAVPSTGGD
nr:uncharacterized protein LOC116821808 [Chelonoidis abingdonii]